VTSKVSFKLAEMARKEHDLPDEAAKPIAAVATTAAAMGFSACGDEENIAVGMAEGLCGCCLGAPNRDSFVSLSFRRLGSRVLLGKEEGGGASASYHDCEGVAPRVCCVSVHWHSNEQKNGCFCQDNILVLINV
jgi:hypothetical protein